MVRTQIRLTEEQAKQLRKIAAERHVPVAELIRTSVDQLLKSNLSEDRIARAKAAAGRFRSNSSDGGVNHDKYLAEIYLNR